MFILHLMLGCAVCSWMYFLWSRRKYYKLAFQIPGPVVPPIIGLVYKMARVENVFATTKELFDKFGSHYFSWMGLNPTLFTCDPCIVEQVLTSSKCLNKSHVYVTLRETFGDGLITIKNPEWSVSRNKFKHSFTHENAVSFVPIFNKAIKHLAKDFEELNAQGPFAVLPIVKKHAMNIAFQTTMGLKLIDDNHTPYGKDNNLLEQYMCIAGYVPKLILNPWFRSPLLQKILPSLQPYVKGKKVVQKFVYNHIRERLLISNTTDNGDEPNDSKFLTKKVHSIDGIRKNKNIFIESAIEWLKEDLYTAKNVVNHANQIFFAAFDATAITISNALMLLAMNPECQQRAFEEMSDFFGSRDDMICFEDVKQLNYLDMVIKETMRLIATVPIAGRKTISDVQLSNGIVLPKGAEIYIDIFNMHRSEKIWGPNALIFNPDNFLPENINTKHSYAYIPFSKGSRNCFGWQYGLLVTKIAIVTIVRKYKVSTQAKFEDIRFYPEIGTKIMNPPLLNFQLR